MKAPKGKPAYSGMAVVLKAEYLTFDLFETVQHGDDGEWRPAAFAYLLALHLRADQTGTDANRLIELSKTFLPTPALAGLAIGSRSMTRKT